MSHGDPRLPRLCFGSVASACISFIDLTFLVFARQREILVFHSSDGVGKIPRLKSFEVARTLADPNEMYWKRELLSDRDEYAAACGAVELGHHKARNPGDAAENLDLVDRVLANRRIKHEKNGMGRVRLDFFMERIIFSSSAMSSARFCRRPAVSIT